MIFTHIMFINMLYNIILIILQKMVNFVKYLTFYSKFLTRRILLCIQALAHIYSYYSYHQSALETKPEVTIAKIKCKECACTIDFWRENVSGDGRPALFINHYWSILPYYAGFHDQHSFLVGYVYKCYVNFEL